MFLSCLIKPIEFASTDVYYMDWWTNPCIIRSGSLLIAQGLTGHCSVIASASRAFILTGCLFITSPRIHHALIDGQKPDQASVYSSVSVGRHRHLPASYALERLWPCYGYYCSIDSVINGSPLMFPPYGVDFGPEVSVLFFPSPQRYWLYFPLLLT